MKENITPHKIAVVLFIKEFCMIKAKARPGQLLTCEDGSFYSVEAVHRRDFCMLVLKLIQSPDMELSEFMALLQSGRYTWLPAHITALKKALADINDGGVCAIQTLIHELNSTVFADSALLQPVVNKSSIIGLFLRRIIIFFDKLTFSQVVAVYRSFKAYFYRAKLSGTDLGCVLENYTAGTSALPDSVLSEDMEISSAIENDFKLSSPCANSKLNTDVLALEGEAVSWTRRQAELFIAQQVNLLQNNESQALPPPKLQEKIRDILDANPDYAEAHYLSYLNCLRVREYCGAIDSLFHCFDRNTAIAASSNTIDDKNKSFRYATLNLAILHAQFGQKGEALCALREAVQMAHEANDDICLQHAQTWLYRLSTNNKEVLIQRSINRSSDLKLSYLTSLGIQSFAQCAGITGTKPSLVFEILMKSDALNCQNSMFELLANSFAQKAALWFLYGKTEMSSLSSQLLLRLHTQDAVPHSGFSSESTCLALCSVTNAFIQEGKYQLASVLLQRARQLFPHEPISHAWMYTEQLLYFFEALHNGRWQEAEQAVSRMSSVHKWDSLLRKAELLLAKGDAVGAMAAVHSVLDAPASEGDLGSGVGLHSTHSTGGGARLSVRVRALILSAEAQSVNGPAPATAVCVLTTALAVAQQNYLDLLAALVACHLANLQLQLGLPAQALQLLDEWLLVVLAHGGAYDRGRALLLLAKCRVAAITAGPSSRDERQKVVTEAINSLDRAKALFTQVEAISRVKDVLYLQALLYNEVDCVVGRKKCALEFRALDEQHPTKIATTLLNRF